jgi:LysR family transcriptional regulator, transcriptional activator of the cysJI operon
MPDSFDHLRLFRDIVDLSSISQGAQRNHITQSAASQHLRELERGFRTTLLDRSTRPFTLTSAGRLYYEMAADVLARHQAFLEALNQTKGSVQGVVRVAAIYSVGIAGMSKMEAEFSSRYPQARVEMEYLRPEKVYAAVRQDQAEIGLVSYPQAARDLMVKPWLSERMVVAVGLSHPLANHKKVRPTELSGLDFAAFDADLPIQRHIDRFLRAHGAAVNIAMHLDNIPMVKEVIALGKQIAILPERILEEDVRLGRLRVIPMTVDLRRPLGIVRRKGRQLSLAGERFLELLSPGR